MTLREKIDGLHTAKTGWVKLADVLRIVAEHERQQVCAMCEVELNTEQAIKDGTLPVLDLTPGMQPRKGGDLIVPKPSQRSSDARESVTAPPVGQAGGEPERWDKNLPSTQIPAYLCAACTLEVEVGETFGFCPKCSKPLEMNPRWVAETPEVEQMAKQQEPAETPRWRKELERLLIERSRKNLTCWRRFARSWRQRCNHDPHRFGQEST